MKTLFFPSPILLDEGDTLTITYTAIDGRRINRLFHSFRKPRVFNCIVMDECSTEDLIRFNVSDGFMMILANK